VEVADASAVRPRSFERWAALGGVLYVVLFVVGTIVFFDGTAGGDDAPAKVIRYYSDSGHRDKINIGWILIGLAIFFFLWFLAVLRQAVRRIDGDGILAGIVGIGGGVYAAVAFAAVALNDGIRTMSDDTYHHQVYPALIHAADDAGYVMHATGAAALGALIIAASLAGLWGKTVPRWAAWIGVIVGILSIASIVFFTQFLFLLWILIVSIGLFMRPAPGTTAPAS
jgi:hypothetical protein